MLCEARGRLVGPPGVAEGRMEGLVAGLLVGLRRLWEGRIDHGQVAVYDFAR